MYIYHISSDKMDRIALGMTIASRFPDGLKRKEVGGSWLVSSDLEEAREVFELLNTRGTEFNNILVFRVEFYHGFADKTLWSWIDKQRRTF
jgi:hypothetical protein